MKVFDKFFTKFAYKFDKGYPDMDNPKDILLLESLLSKLLDEKITSTIILGCLIVLIGIYLSNSNKKGYMNSVNTKA